MTNTEARELYLNGNTTVYGVERESITEGTLVEADGGCIAIEISSRTGLWSVQGNWYAARQEAEDQVAAYTAECDKRRAAREAQNSKPRRKRSRSYNMIEDGEPDWAINSEL